MYTCNQIPLPPHAHSTHLETSIWGTISSGAKQMGLVLGTVLSAAITYQLSLWRLSTS